MSDCVYLSGSWNIRDRRNQACVELKVSSGECLYLTKPFEDSVNSIEVQNILKLEKKCMLYFYFRDRILNKSSRIEGRAECSAVDVKRDTAPYQAALYQVISFIAARDTIKVK